MPEGGVDIWSVVAVVVVLVVVFFFWSRRSASDRTRPRRGIPEDIAQACIDVVGAAPHRGFKRGGRESGWLLEVGGGIGSPGFYVLVRPVSGAAWPELAAFRAGLEMPRFMTQSEGGFFARLQPLKAPQFEEAFAADWQAYSHPASEPVSDLVQRMGRASRIEGASKILAIAVRGDYLVLWSDSLNLRPMLQAVPGILDALVRTAPASPE